MTGTDWSFKLTPFYTWVNGWQQQTFIGAGFVTQVPVGYNRDYGMEFALNKGDFNRDGISGAFNFTYTNSKVKFQNWNLSTGGTITNTTTVLNQVIAQYNALTKGGGGSACYEAGSPAPCNAKPICVSSSSSVVGCGTAGSHIAFTPVLNPYYNAPVQGELDPNGWYNPYSTAIAPNLYGNSTSYISPVNASLILNYRKGRLAVTPSFQFQAGAWYGSPLDNTGLDPRACALNSKVTGITKVSPKTNPLQCNYLTAFAAGLGQFGYFYVPNLQTGNFSAMGSYENPNQLVGNLQISYDVSSKVKVTLTGTNVFHTCFGGQAEPWTAANPPSPNICGYLPAGGYLNSSVYPANFYNGTSIYDKAANKVTSPAAFNQSYLPAALGNSALGASVPPFNLYLNAQIKI
jgi:hypothetical protein